MVWEEWDEVLDGYHATAGIDPKRPYGNMTFYLIDMAHALGIEFSSRDQLQTQKDSLYRLHQEMQLVTQIFLENATWPAPK